MEQRGYPWNHRMWPCVLTMTLIVLLLWGLAYRDIARAASDSSSRSSLIGALEGPEVVTDLARFPLSFKEAPQLTELVKAGKLPPVAERIGYDPIVVKPLQAVGSYGGTWRRGFTG